jgi:hypothetical protein
MRTKFASLSNFFGGSFNQDWVMENRNPEEVLVLFVRENPIETVTNVVRELNQLLSMNLSDVELEDVFYRDLRCDYMPETPVRDWLIFVKDSLTTLMKA